jgi:hypothetical protein
MPTLRHSRIDQKREKLTVLEIMSIKRVTQLNNSLIRNYTSLRFDFATYVSPLLHLSNQVTPHSLRIHRSLILLCVT